MAEEQSQHQSGQQSQARQQDPVHEQSLSYEQARDELADVVRRLEAGNSTLEESLALWERGEKLATVCEQWLGGVRARLAEATAAETEQAETER